MTAARFHLFTAVWGDWHLDMFEQITLPTLLAEANVPRASRRHDLQYTVYTRDSDCARIAGMPIVQRMAGVVGMAVVGLTSDDSVAIDNHMSWWTTAINKAEREGALAVAIHPDVVWADGSFTYLADALARGKKGVLIPNLRIVSETSVPEIRRDYGFNPTIAISPRRLMAIAMRHLHPLSMAEISGIKPFTPGQDRLWPVAREGFIARTIGRDMIFFDPRRCNVNKNTFTIGSLDLSEVELMDDSDDFLTLNLTPLSKDIGLLRYETEGQLENPAKWSMDPIWDTSVADELARRTIRFRIAAPTEDKWRAVESEAEREFSLVRNMRRLLKAQDAIRTAGCDAFAKLFGTAAQITDLPATLQLSGQETLFAPTDESLGSLSSGPMAKLIAPGNEAALARMIARHVGGKLDATLDLGGAQIVRSITVDRHVVRVLDRSLAS